jgi:hypothetical protein
MPTENCSRYKAFDNMAIRKFYLLLRATILKAKSVSLLKMLVNEQSLTTMTGRLPAAG